MCLPENSFVYGMGSFFNILNKEHRKCFHIAQKNRFFFHSSIGYPGSSFFFKTLSNREFKNNNRLILKIAGYSYDQLRYEVDESLKEFNLSNLYGFQLWEKLPMRSENIDIKELNKIIYFLEDLKKNDIIKKIFFQLEPNKFQIDEIDFFDGYAFYGYPNEIQLEKKHYDYIINKKKIFLQFQFFGGRSTKIFRESFKNKLIDPNNVDIDFLWINSCLEFSQNNFGKKIFYVGCTQKSRRLLHLAKKIKENQNFTSKSNDMNFSDNLMYLTKVNYPIDNHFNHLKKIRSKKHLFKLYLKKNLKI